MLLVLYYVGQDVLKL